MRLIHARTLEIHEFFPENVPQYAILSHRWESEEVTFEDLRDERAKAMGKAGFDKIKQCCARAALDSIEYVWIDSCCIDKSSSAELSEAINSMFKWYGRAHVCYAYLSDVPSSKSYSTFEIAFRNSQWFKRGWTLQELLAPDSVEFFDQNWTDIGTKASLQELIKSVTGITQLFNYNDASVAQKLSWASRRKTTRVEDQAYCLLGLFDINMPPLYGEGENAFQRLQLEILRKTDDESIFAWDGKVNGLNATGRPYEGMLASSISAFETSWRFQRATFDSDRSPYSMTNKGLHLELQLYPAAGRVTGALSSLEVFIAPLNCYNTEYSGSESFLAVTLVNMPGGWVRMRRSFSMESERLLNWTAPVEKRAIYIKGLQIQSQINGTISLRASMILYKLETATRFGFSVARRYFRGSHDHSHWRNQGDCGTLPFMLDDLWLSGSPVALLLRKDDAVMAVVVGKGTGDKLWVETLANVGDNSLHDIATGMAKKWKDKVGPDRSSCELSNGLSVLTALRKRTESERPVYIADIFIHERND